MPGTLLNALMWLALAAPLAACGTRNELVYAASATAAEAEAVYLDEKGDEQTETVQLPWHFALRAGNDTTYALTVTRGAGSPGTVACEVAIDEQRVAQAEA